MRGFLVGTVALIALYAFVQPNAGRAAEAGSNAVVEGLRRLLSADVAGVPQKKTGGTQPNTASMSGSRPAPVGK